MPRPSQVDEPPADGRGHRGPVGPHAVLDGAVEVEHEEGHHVGDAGLGHGALAPGLKGSGGGGVLRGALLGRVGVVGELGDGGDLAVEVVLEGGLEALHDFDQVDARQGDGVLEGGEMVLELGEAVEESCWGEESQEPCDSCLSMKPTMLLVCFCKNGLVLQQFLDLGEERGLLIIVVRLDKLDPGKAVTGKVGPVSFGHDPSLVVDGVVAAEDRVVWVVISAIHSVRSGICRAHTQQGHVGCARGEEVGLQVISHQRMDCDQDGF